MKKPFSLFCVALLCVASLFANGAAEGATPQKGSSVQLPKRIQLIVASTAGGFADTHARIISNYLQETSGINVAVVNQPDGGGIVAYDNVKNAKKDGSTLLFYHTNFALACVSGVYNADPIKDFTVISEMETGGAQVMVVSAKSKYKTLDDYINDSLARPNEVSYGMQTGGASQIMAALLGQDKGNKLKMVEAGNQTEKIASLLGGYIDACNIGAASASQYVANGDMRVLCNFGNERDPYYPDFPTAKEQGYPACVYTADFWIHGPAGMDPALVSALNDLFKGLETDQKVKELLAKQTSSYTWKDLDTANADYVKVVETLDKIATAIGLKK